MNHIITANIVNIKERKIYKGQLEVRNGKIFSKVALGDGIDDSLPFVLPGFIDAHVHIESSMLVPSEFAKIAVTHGTVGTISDPHEIANVCGIAGIDFMIENGKTVPFKFHFGAPSCVPATSFETAGAAINASDIEELMKRDDIYYLSEMMNYPGVLHDDPKIFEKIKSAKRYGKPTDGHAPGVRGVEIKKYIAAGISTDHECTSKEEAEEKLKLGMKILIREGSAAKNFDALIDLLNNYPDEIMFCSDDKHPDSLVEGHINVLCKRAAKKGINIFKILKAACVNPVEHYKMKVGILEIGNAADFIVVRDLENFIPIQTYINGDLVAENGKSVITTHRSKTINNFNCSLKSIADFEIPYSPEAKLIPIIEALDGQLLTNKAFVQPKVENLKTVSDPENDILKIVVVNRYHNAPIAKAFVKGFGLKNCAIASSVAHDSHNIICVGNKDEDICTAVNLLISKKGGVSLYSHRNVNSSLPKEMLLELPVAGLMSNEDGFFVAEKYTQIDNLAKDYGSHLSAPFMTLSFLALLVIPSLKLSDLGLFDVNQFCFVKN